MKTLIPTYTLGTHRAVAPQETLKKISPHLQTCGITRCADITHLDMLGLPVYSAIRPEGLVLQTANGKGLTKECARVSALMEAIECYHAENPDPDRLHRNSYRSLKNQGEHVLHPADIDGFVGQFNLDTYIIDWVAGEDLLSGKRVWAPASAIYFGCEPLLYNTSTNGLASGNHIVEATLHALYELIERDAGSRLSVDGKLKIKERCQVLDSDTIDDIHLRPMLDRIQETQNKLVLLWVESAIQLHTFWAVLLDKKPFSRVSTFNIGWGTHLDVQIAAIRAVTEAIQSRGTFIQGSREDVVEKPVYSAQDVDQSPAYKYFDNLKGTATWKDVTAQFPSHTVDFFASYEQVLTRLSETGHRQILRFDLSKTALDIPVVKCVVPSLKFNRKLF